MKKITLILLLIFTLTSCNMYNVETPQQKKVIGDPKLQDLENYEQLNIPTENTNIPSNIRKEINDRKQGFSNLNKSKAYYKSKEVSLVKNINDFNNYVEITRKLMLADVKIVKAVLNGYLKEEAINKNNYFYNYIKKNKDNKEKKQSIIKDVDVLLKVLSEKKKFDLLFYLNLDLNQVENLGIGTSKIYFYTKLYFKQLSYKDDIIKTLQSMYDNLNILKINRYRLYQDTGLGFLKSDVSYIYKEPLKNLLNELKK